MRHGLSRRDRLHGRVGVDETYIGGEGTVQQRGRGATHKALVVIGAQEDGRGIGRIRMARIPKATRNCLHGFIRETLEPGSVVRTDGLLAYRGLEAEGYAHEVSVVGGWGDDAAVRLLPRVHRVASLLKRWLVGTRQGAVSPEHLGYYLDEFTFRFNRRRSASRGRLFYRLIQQAVQVVPGSLPIHRRRQPPPQALVVGGVKWITRRYFHGMGTGLMAKSTQNGRVSTPQDLPGNGQHLRKYHETKLGIIYHGDSGLLFERHVTPASVDLIMTSPPFGLVRKKTYGNVDAHKYLAWFKPFAKAFHRALKPSGSLVIDIGGAWIPGQPTRSLYHYELLIMLCRECGFHLAQDFFWWNPARLPTPAEWVTVRRIRVKDAVNCIWWLSKTPWPRASNRRVLVPYSERIVVLYRNVIVARKRPPGRCISTKPQEGGRQDCHWEAISALAA